MGDKDLSESTVVAFVDLLGFAAAIENLSSKELDSVSAMMLRADMSSLYWPPRDENVTENVSDLYRQFIGFHTILRDRLLRLQRDARLSGLISKFVVFSDSAFVAVDYGFSELFSLF